MIAVCATATTVAGALGCSPARDSVDHCVGDDPIAMPVAAQSPESASAEPSSVPVEVLWTADASGVLRAFDGRTGQALASVDTGRAEFPPGLVFGGGLVWVYRTDGGIALVDPAQARVSGRARVTQVQPLADNKWYFAQGSLWIAQPGRLWRLSPSGEVSSIELPSGFRTTAMTATDRWLWLAAGRRLVRVDPEARTTTVTVDLPVDAGIGRLVGTHIGLVAVGRNQAQIWVLDPDTANLSSTIRVTNGELVGSVFDTGDALWATGNCGHVMKVTGTDDPQVQKVKISDVSQDFSARIAFGSLWVADEDRSELVRVDLRTASVVARIPVKAADPDDPAFTVFAGEHSLWLIDAKGFMRVDPSTNRTLPRTLFMDASLGASVVAAPPPQ